jgi:predicted nucleotidyltransferase
MYEAVGENKGYIFDFDDTLAKTPAKVHVLKNQKRVKSLSPQIFNTYRLKDGEVFDFSDFDDPNILRQAKKFKIWKVLKNVEGALGQGRTDSEMYILTARSKAVRDALHEFLVSNGIRSIPKTNIFTVGDSGDTPIEERDTRSIAERKKEVLANLRKRHEGDVIFFDDDQKNIDLALEVPGIKTRLVKEEFEESILDEPRKTMNPLIWDLQADDLTLKANIHDAVLDGLIDLVGEVPVENVYIVGSLTGTRFNEDADLDVTVVVDTDEETHKHLRKRAIEINGKFAPGTKHPINYFVQNEDPGLDRFDSAYDFKTDKWIKPPKDHGVDLFNVYDEFRQYIKEIDVEKEEALRSLIDIDILMSAIETGGDAKMIFDKILQRFKALDYSVKNMADKYDEVHKERVDAFMRFEGGNTQGLPSPNLLPENIRYKLLERYHYLDFMKKLLDLVDVTGDIDTAGDLEAVRKILSEEAKQTCPEYRKGGWRNHDEEDVEEGRRLFEKSLKDWNDKATGKKKDKPTVKADRKSDMVEETLVEASFGADRYKPPKHDKQQMMMDFYFLTGVSQMLPEFAAGLDMDEMDNAVNFVLEQIVDFVQKDLAAATFFAICAEMRHVYAQNDFKGVAELIKDHDTPGTQQITVKTVKKDSPDFKLNIPYDVSNTEEVMKMWKKYTVSYAGLNQFNVGPSDDRLIKYGEFGVQKGSQRSYVHSWKAAKNASKGDNISFAELAKFCFLKARWSDAYGGGPWAGIAHFYIEVATARTLQEKIDNIDKLFSLQHNTGTVLNKVQNYTKDGSHQWIGKALDFKFNVRDFWEYKDKVSPGLSRIVAATSKVISGKSAQQKEKKDEIEAIPEVGDKVRHQDLGYLGPIEVVKVMKKTDPKHGVLVKLKNPETGKNFNAFSDQLELVADKPTKTPPKGGIGSIAPTGKAIEHLQKEYPAVGPQEVIKKNHINIGKHKGYLEPASSDNVKPGDILVLKSQDLKLDPGATAVVNSISITKKMVEVSWIDPDGPQTDGLYIWSRFFKFDHDADRLHVEDNYGNKLSQGDMVKITKWTIWKKLEGATATLISSSDGMYDKNKQWLILKLQTPVRDPDDKDGNKMIENVFIIDHPSDQQQIRLMGAPEGKSIKAKIGKSGPAFKQPKIDITKLEKVKQYNKGDAVVIDKSKIDWEVLKGMLKDDSLVDKYRKAANERLVGVVKKIIYGSPEVTFNIDGERVSLVLGPAELFYVDDDVVQGGKSKLVDPELLDLLGVGGSKKKIDHTPFSDLEKGDKVKVVQWHDKTSPVLGSIGTYVGKNRNDKSDDIYYKVELDEKVGPIKGVTDSTIKNIYFPTRGENIGKNLVLKVREDEGEDEPRTLEGVLEPSGDHPTIQDFENGDIFYLIKMDPEFGVKSYDYLIAIVQSVEPSGDDESFPNEWVVKTDVYKANGQILETLVKFDLSDLHKMSNKDINKGAPWLKDAPLNKPKITKPKDEDIDFTELQATGNLDEYFLALEGIMNKIEFTNGKPNFIKTAGRRGMRVDRGSRGALKRRRMSGRERMRRKTGAMKSNIKTKARGKLAQANRKKTMGQKLNPNSPTGKF